jgi:hypothetical protein
MAVFAAAAADLVEEVHYKGPRLNSAADVEVHNLAWCIVQESRTYRAVSAAQVELFGRTALLAVVEIGKSYPSVGAVAAAAAFAKDSAQLQNVAEVDSAVRAVVAAPVAGRSTPVVQLLALVRMWMVERRSSVVVVVAAVARHQEEPN